MKFLKKLYTDRQPDRQTDRQPDRQTARVFERRLQLECGKIDINDTIQKGSKLFVQFDLIRNNRRHLRTFFTWIWVC